MYLEIERRQPPPKWGSRSQISKKAKSQPVQAASVQRRAAEPAKAREPETCLPQGLSETAQLAEELRVLAEANTELEAFNASVCHDLCTPLTAINGYCQVLTALCHDQLDEQSQEYLQGIYDGTLRMKQLIVSLLDFARTSRVKVGWEALDLSQVARAVAGELKLAAPERRVSFRIAQGITGKGDPGLWRCVLDNLIGNAWKHGAGPRETVIEFGRTELAGEAVCFVRDNGPGFDMALADQLFQPFQRAPGTEVAGSGIGLATVERIVRRHGGRVWAESRPGAGATFYFTMA
jgi:signal transduction histidine kinase